MQTESISEVLWFYIYKREGGALDTVQKKSLKHCHTIFK